MYQYIYSKCITLKYQPPILSEWWVIFKKLLFVKMLECYYDQLKAKQFRESRMDKRRDSEYFSLINIRALMFQRVWMDFKNSRTVLRSMMNRMTTLTTDVRCFTHSKHSV
jgi:hypothetical protein